MEDVVQKGKFEFIDKESYGEYIQALEYYSLSFNYYIILFYVIFTLSLLYLYLIIFIHLCKHVQVLKRANQEIFMDQKRSSVSVAFLKELAEEYFRRSRTETRPLRI